MEELQVLVGMVKDLPMMAIWVLAFFFVYKVVVVGSIFGVIKLAINRAHSWLTTPKHTLKVVDVDVRAKLDGMAIIGCFEKLIVQIERLKGIRSRSIPYIHEGDVTWLREAIDEKLERESKKS